MKFKGKLKEGVTATNLVLTVTELLRKEKVVGNMSPEYGVTCGFFPVDERTLACLHLAGRDEATLALALKLRRWAEFYLHGHRSNFLIKMITTLI